MTLRFEHHDVDELAAALALGAVDADELRAAREHLETCAEPHAELRSFLGVDVVLAAGLDPVEPSAALRDRLMSSIAATPRAAAPSPERAPSDEPRRGWLDWLSPRVARPLALAGVAAALVLAVVSVTLTFQLAERDRSLREVAQALASNETAYRVAGEAGIGYVVDTEGPGASFVVAGVRGPLDENQLYELWLIGPDETPVDVGTFRPTGDTEITVIPVEQDLAGFNAFAVTIEAERVESPTLPIVMAGEIGG